MTSTDPSPPQVFAVQELADQIYRGVLGRPIDPVGLADAMELLASDPGGGAAELIGRTIASAEFTRRRPLPDAHAYLHPDDAGVALLLDFADERSLECCGAGWSYREGSSNWCVGEDSTLLFPAPDTAHDCLLTIDFVPLWDAARAPTRQLSVIVNGHLVGHVTTGDRHPASVTCTLPADMIARRTSMTVRLVHPDPIRPSDLDYTSSDDRELSFQVTEVRLQELTDDYRQRREALSRALHTPIASSPPGRGISSEEHARLVSLFEPFGENCEFGFVQRLAGVEPLALLRFVGLPLHKLVRAIQSRFADLCTPGALTLERHGDEVMGREHRYRMLYHVPVPAGLVDMDRLHEAEVTRLRYLARKLLEDIEDGRKILLFKNDRPVSLDGMIALLDAIRAVGDTTLLWVEQDSAKAGMVEMIEPGLMKGYLDHVGDLDAGPHTISVTCWSDLLASAAALHDTAASLSPMANPSPATAA